VRSALTKSNALMFEVEETTTVRSTGQAFVLARQLAPSQWELGNSPRLGGVEIFPVAERPWTVDAAGKPRQDLFAFCLREASDVASFSPGQIVELKP
jgi:hypothetical protein